MSSWLGIPALLGIIIVRMPLVVRALRGVGATPVVTTATTTDSAMMVVVAVVLVAVVAAPLSIADRRVSEVAVPTVHITVAVLLVDWAYVVAVVAVRFALGGGGHPNLTRVGSLHANRIVLYLS